MSSLHEVRSDQKSRAYLVSVQTPQVNDAENKSTLDELSRLVSTLGYEVVGRMTQKRSGTGSAFVLGEGKLLTLAKITGGPGPKAVKPTIPNANNPKRKKAFARDEESDEDEDEGYDGDDGDESDEFDGASERLENEGFGESENDSGSDIGSPSGANFDDRYEAKGEEIPKARPDVVIFDSELTPSQTRNLERALGCDVMDRTGVIIEIFSRHARTRAARLQVEIARLTYLAPRIRETGGGGDRGGGGVGAKGAGETSVELDRRKIRDRIKELKGEFESIEKEHDTRRARRSDVRTVALVGYTNAGKSSMMRAMTGSEVYVADKLFATLDTTVRPLHPPSRPPILMSDTVGFIKKLPHDLVASFKSTLDEATHASLLLFVVDASDASFRSQLEVTRAVLGEVGAGDAPSRLVLNKADKLADDEKARLMAEFPEALLVSTRSKESLQELREHILTFFEGDMVDEDVFVPYTVQGAIGEIRAQMRVLEESYEAEGVRLRLRARQQDLSRLRNRYHLG